MAEKSKIVGHQERQGRQKCTFCKGTGKQQQTGWKCDVCGGTGKMPVVEEPPSDTPPSDAPPVTSDK